MALLNRSALLKKDVLKIEKVFLDDTNYVYVRQMNGRERDRFEQSLVKEVTDTKGRSIMKRTLDDFRAKLAVNVVCDSKGNNIFEPNDVEQLSTNMSAAKLETIINKAQKLNAISNEDKEKMIKNSESGQSEDSISDSAAN